MIMSDVGIELVSCFGRFGKCVLMCVSVSSVVDDSDEIVIGKFDWIVGCGLMNGVIVLLVMFVRFDIRLMFCMMWLCCLMFRCVNVLFCMRLVYVMLSSVLVVFSVGIIDGFCSSVCSDSLLRFV